MGGGLNDNTDNQEIRKLKVRPSTIDFKAFVFFFVYVYIFFLTVFFNNKGELIE